MSAGDKTRTIAAVRSVGPSRLQVTWSDETSVELNLLDVLRDHAFDALRDPAEFERVQIGDWGHGLVWPSGAELGAESLWLETLTALGRDDTRKFLEWRLRHALSLTTAAEALGVSRRMVAYYSNGEKAVPRPILLACLGWEASCAA